MFDYFIILTFFQKIRLYLKPGIPFLRNGLLHYGKKFLKHGWKPCLKFGTGVFRKKIAISVENLIKFGLSNLHGLTLSNLREYLR